MSGSLNRTTRASLKLWEQWSIGWLVSAIVNLLVLTVTAIWLLPVDLPSVPVALVARVDTDEGDLEALVDLADLEPLNFDKVLELSQSEPAVAPEVQVDLFAIGGTAAEGTGGSPGGPGSGGAEAGTEYFGTVAQGDRFVYILDKSISMNWNRHGQAGPNSRFGRARYELLRSIDKLAPNQQFYVILFSYSTNRMFDDKSPAPATIPATPENKRRLRQWLERVEMGSGTDPRDALYLALSISPDAVFLLSDGDFNQRFVAEHLFEGSPTPEELVKQFNRSYTPIHTIAYENPISNERMEVLAELSRGKYRYIPPMESTADDSVPRRRRR